MDRDHNTEKENYDYLTGLYNRKGMYELWNDRISAQRSVQVLFLDLDNFKSVNDIYGHKIGDRTLIRTGEILVQSVRQTDLVIRLGGDEFVIMIPGEKKREDLQRMADRLLGDLQAEGMQDKAFGVISASIGIVCNADTSEGIDKLLSYSDTAMYYAKNAGKNRYIFFDDYADRIRVEREIESTVETALEEGRFHMLYYPVIHLQNAKIMRSIAVAVWEKQNGEILYRSQYEQILEKSGFIRKVDIFAFEQLCRDYAKIRQAAGGESVVGIRLSRLTLEKNAVQVLRGITQKYGVPEEALELLVDECFLGGRSTELLRKSINELKEAGFSLGLMNFGEDFSSFRFLENLPVSTVFFDSEYVMNEKEEERKSILYTLFHLTRNMRLFSVGQGVRNAEDAMFLLKNGCDGATGPLYGERRSLEEYMEYLSGIVEQENMYHYDFLHDYATTQGAYPGRPVGGGVERIPGISDVRGGVRFGGGPVNTNLLEFPGELLTNGSFSIAMWVRPREVQDWISVFYARMQNGFISFMPSVSGNVCMFRMHADGDVPWTDVMTDSLPIGKWSYIVLVYDAFSDMIRLFVDGELAGMKGSVPKIGESSRICVGGDCYQVSYRGDVSALSFYGSALTEEEVRRHYLQYKEEAGFSGDEEADIQTEYVTHDPAIFEDPVSGKFYIYGTHAKGMVSGDLEHWESLPKIVTVPEEATAWTGSTDVWAPDIVKVREEYRLYCSNSSWGVQQSCIFLAVSDRAEGPFLPRGVVLKTDDTLDVNGIDANIITDHETGEQYMLYGSFWGGVHLLPLEKESGLARDRGADGNGVGSLRLTAGYKEGMQIGDLSQEEQERRRGICLARRPLWTDGAIEGPYMVYCKETGYYYLFVSFGSLQSDYNIRIGRSRRVTGPFLDYFGKDLADIDDPDCSRGLMISAGYRWLTGMPYMGPGHNSVLQRKNGEIFMVFHIRRMRYLEQECGNGLLQIRRLYPTPDGWLIAGAQPYAREAYPIAEPAMIPGAYERIELRPSMPQGIMQANPLMLCEDGRLECCSVRGRWRQTGADTLEFTYGPITEYVHIEYGLDHDINRTTVLLTGLNSRGICTWAKKQLQ